MVEMCWACRLISKAFVLHRYRVYVVIRAIPGQAQPRHQSAVLAKHLKYVKQAIQIQPYMARGTLKICPSHFETSTLRIDGLGEKRK